MEALGVHSEVGKLRKGVQGSLHNMFFGIGDGLDHERKTEFF